MPTTVTILKISDNRKKHDMVLDCWCCWYAGTRASQHERGAITTPSTPNATMGHRQAAPDPPGAAPGPPDTLRTV